MSKPTHEHFWLGLGGVAALGIWLGLTFVFDRRGADVDLDAGPGIGSESPGEESGGIAAERPSGPAGPDVESATELDRVAEKSEELSWLPGGENEPSVEDVQEWTWLREDIDRLIDEARPKARKRLDAEDIKSAYLDATLDYLDLDGEEQERFESAVQTALTAIDDAREQMQRAQTVTPYIEEDSESIQVWRQAQAAFVERQKEEAERIIASLPLRPRTTLLREQALQWVVRYDFGIQHANRPASR